MGVFGSLRCISGLCSCDETLGHCFAPRMEGRRGSHQKASYHRQRETSCPPMNVLLVRLVGVCRLKYSPLTTKPNQRICAWIEADVTVQLAMSFCEFSCE